MADDTPEQPPVAGINPSDLDRLLSGLLSTPAPPTAQPVQNTADNAPSSWTARLGERLAGGAPSDYQMTREQREAEGNRALLNAGLSMMSVGPWATFGQGLASGPLGAMQSQATSELTAAGRQQAAQDWQQTSTNTQIEKLKAALPILQLTGRMGLPSPFAGGGAGGGGSAPAGGGGGGGGPGTPAPTGSLADILKLPKAQFLQAIAGHESGGNPTALNYVARADPSAYAKGATASGKYQMVNSTWLTAAKAAGIDTDKYPTAMSAPEALQDQAASKLYDMQGTKPWDPSAWTKNWVQGSDGKYSLQTSPYQEPPAAGGGKPSTDTPPTQNAGKPTTPPVVAKASPFGGGAFAPPTSTVMPAPATDADAPATTATLPNVPTPALTAAQAIARRTGKPAVIEGTNGATVAPDGKILGNTTFGPRADANAILQGMQQAQTTMPPPAVAAAGPAAGGGTTPAPPAGPAPGTAFGGSAFATAPAARVTWPTTPPPAPPTTQPPATPAPQDTTQAQQPPAPPPAIDLKSRPDTELNPEEYIQKHWTPMTPEEVARYAPGPDNQLAVDKAAAVQRGLAAAEAARNAFMQARAVGSPDQERLFTAMNDANKEADAAEKDYNTAVQSLKTSGAKSLLDADNAQRQQLRADYKASVVDPRNKAAELALQSQHEIDLENVRTGNATNKALLDSVNADAVNSGKRLDDLELLRGLSENAGTPTLLSAIKVGGRSLADIATATGLGGTDLQNKAAAVQAFRAGVLNTVRELRSGGAATGEPRSNQDLQFVQDMAPSEWESPQTRGAIISFLEQVNQRRVDMASEINRLSATHGTKGALMPAGEAVAQARLNVPDMVPQVPREIMQAPADKQWQWFHDNNVKPYTFFRYPNGKVDLYKGPPAQ